MYKNPFRKRFTSDKWSS